MCASKAIRYRTTGRKKNGKQRMPNIIFLETFILLFPSYIAHFQILLNPWWNLKKCLPFQLKKIYARLLSFKTCYRKSISQCYSKNITSKLRHDDSFGASEFLRRMNYNENYRDGFLCRWYLCIGLKSFGDLLCHSKS